MDVWSIAYALAWGVAGISILAVGLLVIARVIFAIKRRSSRGQLPQGVKTLGFFHPYANSGGGGERVLWIAIQALIQSKQKVKIIIYTGDTDSADAIFRKTHDRFGVAFDDATRPTFVRLKRRTMIEAARWPRFTMIGQSIGSMVLGFEALMAYTPDVFIDTTGFAFTYPAAWLLAGCRVAAYVHYPTISTDMLQSVVSKRPTYNNDQSISSSGWRTRAKLAYYHLFALLYRLVGRCCHIVMANSSWTAGHISSLWGKANRVYPPCDVTSFVKFPLGGRVRTVVSVSQYRPEKDQQLQIRALHKLHAEHSDCKDVSLVLIGSCRHADDHVIADNLEKLAAELGIADSVSVLRNLPYSELKAWLGRAKAGIHTMYALICTAAPHLWRCTASKFVFALLDYDRPGGTSTSASVSWKCKQRVRLLSPTTALAQRWTL